jgi:nitrite reductase (NADH) large subunit
MAKKIVIIGNGPAAIAAIKSIREVDQESEIHLFGEESPYPYNRVRLSKGLLTTLREDEILLQKKEWYDDNNIDLYLDSQILSIDIDKKIVYLQDNSSVAYDRLLISTGSHNVKPEIIGIEKQGVYTLKTLQDAWDIMDEIKDNSTCLIIGGGIQGLETAWILSQMDKEVIISHHSQRLMRKFLDEKASKLLEKAIISNGIKILFNTEVNEIIGQDNVEGFKTINSESYICDAIMYSIGTKPNVDFLRNTPLNISRGIIVNEKMETNIEGIFAAGDVAEYDGEVPGLWGIAINQGKVAGYNICSKDTVYNYITPVTTLNAFGLSLFSMGIVDESKSTYIILEDKSDENIYNKVFINNNKIIGAIVVGNIKSSPALKSAIEKKTSIENIEYSNMPFEDFIKALKDEIKK